MVNKGANVPRKPKVMRYAILLIQPFESPPKEKWIAIFSGTVK
jgi:hypothetical protein